MALKGNLALALKILALTVLMFALFALAAGVVEQPGGAGQSAEEQAQAAQMLWVVCLLNTSVLAYIILRSRWPGWRLMAAIFLVFYGVMTFMGQIESAVFLTKLPAGMLPRLFLMGVLIAAPFSVLAVLILGKWRAKSQGHEAHAKPAMAFSAWAWKIALLTLAYVVLYFTFGYFIAWQSPAVRAYYDGVDEGSFFANMRTVLHEQAWLPPFQLLRALMWIGLAWLVVRMMRVERWEAALAVGLLFAVVMNTQLLLPNPFMPEAVRMAHLL